MLKKELRKTFLARQKTLPAAEREEKSRRIAENFFARVDLGKRRVLHCFLPIEKFGEIDTNLIFESVWRDFPHVETLAPRVDFHSNEIESVPYKSETDLKKNVWQISEPFNGEAVEVEQIDLVIVPLLCFDRRGFRVGYGKGFYDRFLKKCRPDCLKIGLSYFAPVEKISDADEFDVRLDVFIMPERIVESGN